MTLTEFLAARIDEDEAAASAAGMWLVAPDAHDDVMLWTGAGTTSPHRILTRIGAERHFDHIARHGPARVLRECETKRRIIERFTWDDLQDEITDPMGVLALLALPYAHHPDYLQEWKP